MGRSPALQKVIDNHALWLDSKGKEGERLDFSGAWLRSANFEEADLSGANFNRSILKSASFCDAFFQDGDFKGADFFRARLVWCYFGYANFEYANFIRTDLRQVNFTGSNPEIIKETDVQADSKKKFVIKVEEF